MAIKIPRRGARLARAPLPPLGIARQYRNLIWGVLDEINATILAIVLEGWDTNPAHNPGTVPKSTKTDALTSSFVVKKIGALDLIVQERFAAATPLSRSIRVLAARMSDQGAVEFRRLVGVKTSDLGVGSSLDAFRDRNVDLIKSLVGTQIDEIEGILGQAEAGAWNGKALADAIQDRFNVTKSKAQLLANDQTLKLNGQITQLRQQNAGITSYIWTTVRDERVRPDHEALDGTVQSWLVAPIVDEKSGRTGHPGDDFQCRCVAIPILPELEEEDTE